LFPLFLAAVAALALASPSFAQSAPDVELHAERLAVPLKVDGHLDEAVYASVPSGVRTCGSRSRRGRERQREDRVLGVLRRRSALRLDPRVGKQHGGLVANEMRRDNTNIFQNDHVAFLLDTFHDRRNGVEFAINAIGGRWDGQISNETQFNATGTRCTTWRSAASRAAGRSRWRSRSSRCATGPAARRCGA
jgi:hypothetical protein